MFKKVMLAAATAALISGCATSRGFNRAELRDQVDGQKTVTDEQIREVLALKPQLPKPFRLGVYFKDPVSRDHSWKPKWHWTDADKEKILSAVSHLKDSHELSDVFSISDATVSATDVKSLRFAAAQHGADALLVVSGISDTDSYNNNWGWTYIALVTALCVPGSVTDGLFLAKAAMWDVRNEYLYMTADSESLQEQTRPAAFTDDRKVIDEAKTAAVEKLRQELSNRVMVFSGKKPGI